MNIVKWTFNFTVVGESDCKSNACFLIIDAMYSTSSQVKNWIFEDAKELESSREDANGRFLAETLGDDDDGELDEETKAKYLTMAEERQLVQHYEYVLKDFCGKFSPAMPKYVVGTTMAYMKVGKSSVPLSSKLSSKSPFILNPLSFGIPFDSEPPFIGIHSHRNIHRFPKRILIWSFFPTPLPFPCSGST